MTTTRIAIAFLIALSLTPAHAEYFVDLGISASRVQSKINGRSDTVDSTDAGVHFGVGGRRPISERSDIGIRLELDTIDSNLLLAVRALDYRRHLSERLAWGVFGGAARLDLATPAYGWYVGGGIELKKIVENWILNIDVRLGDKLARDNLLPGEERDGSPDNFHDLTSVSVYLSRRF